MITQLLPPSFPVLLAHAVSPESSGFLEGVLHPVFGPDHLAAILGVGLLALRKPSARMLHIPLAFVGILLAGALTGLAGFFGEPPEVLLALSVSAVGLLLLCPKRAKALSLWLVVLVTGFLHGYAHGFESPEGHAPLFFAGFALGTALLLGAGLLLSLIFQELKRGEQFRRAAGAAAAVAGMVFAVQLFL